MAQDGASKLLIELRCADMERAQAATDAEVAQARSAYKAAAARLQERKAALLECEQGIADLQRERAELNRALTAAASEKKRLENK